MTQRETARASTSLYKIPKRSPVLVALRYNLRSMGFIEASDFTVAYRDLSWVEEKLEHERLGREPQLLDHIVCAAYCGAKVSESPTHRGVHDLDQESLLGTNVIVEARCPHPKRFGDVHHARGPVASLGEQRQSDLLHTPPRGMCAAVVLNTLRTELLLHT